MAELLGVELARPGTWDLAVGGKTPFTAQMLRDAADFFTATGAQPVPVGLGHTDDRFGGQDGDPAFGLVTNIRYVENEPGYDPGPVLLGDVTDVPDWLHAAAPTRWPNRSVEAVADFEYEGRKYGLALTRLAFLGSTPPAMRNLRSLRHVQEALAAAHRIAASAPIAAQADGPHTPAPAAVDAPSEKGAGMSLAKYREVVAGLPDDASDEDVLKALTAAGLSALEPAPPADPPQPAPTNPPPPQPQPVGDPQPVADPAQQTLDQKLAAAAAKGGVLTLDSSQAAQLQETQRRFAALEAKLDQRERDEAIGDAIKAGKIAPARRKHYEQYWDGDREGAKLLLASLHPGLVPVDSMGYSGDGSEDAMWRAEFGPLFPPDTVAKGR